MGTRSNTFSINCCYYRTDNANWKQKRWELLLLMSCVKSISTCRKLASKIIFTFDTVTFLLTWFQAFWIWLFKNSKGFIFCSFCALFLKVYFSIQFGLDFHVLYPYRRALGSNQWLLWQSDALCFARCQPNCLLTILFSIALSVRCQKIILYCKRGQ